ncbi:hypothetical protein HRI_001377100 [Hibiscus trionum]|uniref:GAG-pre-integrase domain-containing protein n=1 Tax=Hibiscus trionum TaxID=183268 RepID=A0A9W7HHP9_HIBTR|nr:hypothetical protein HRI_001377100 [Hibiscus trionum]
MATTSSTTSSSIPSSLTSDSSMYIVQQLPKLDTIKLSASTYVLWKHQVMLIIEGYGLVSFLTDHKIPDKVTSTDSGQTVDNPIFLAYLKQDKLLASWLISAAGPEVLPHLTGLNTSRAIWDALSRRFAAKSTAKISSLRHNLHSQKKRGLSISEYLANIKLICDTLAASGNDVSEQEHVSVILAGLTAEFESVITFASRETQTLENLYEMLLDCEARQQEFLAESFSLQANVVTRSTTKSESYKTDVFDDKDDVSSDKNSSQPENSYFRGQRGGANFRGRGRGRFNFNRPQCQLCGRYGHLVQRCWYRFDQNFHGVLSEDAGSRRSFINSSNDGKPTQSVQGFVSFPTSPSAHLVSSAPTYTSFVPAGPDSFGTSVAFGSPSGFPQPSSSFASHMASSARFPTAPALVGQNSFSPTTCSGAREVVWCPDSGATHHITSDRSNLQSDRVYTGMDSLRVGNGNAVEITHVGVGNISTCNRSLCLRNFLCVPDIKKNLLSVSQFARDNFVFFEFHPDKCFVKDIQTKEILLVGRLTLDGLYELDSSAVFNNDGGSVSATPSMAYNVSKCFSFDLWHKRLGHPSSSVLKSALSSCNISFTNNTLTEVCSSCMKGKAHKLPFQLSTTLYDSPFQLIVSDV